jgi:hypothetical protein
MQRVRGSIRWLISPSGRLSRRIGNANERLLTVTYYLQRWCRRDDDVTES